MDLPSAVYSVDESLGLEVPEGVVVMDSSPTPADNERAMADLMRQMSGVL